MLESPDFLMGALLLAWPRLGLTSTDVLALAVFTFFADIVVNQVSFRLGIRNTKW